MFIAPFDKKLFFMANENYPFIYYNSSSAGPYKGASIDKEKYLEWIQQYKDTDFYDQLLNAFNTYDSQNFSSNWFQDVAWQWFGDATPWYNFENQRNAQFFDNLARIQDAMHQEKHNDVVTQTQLAKDAGINTDLTGNVPSSPAGNVDNLEAVQPNMLSSESIMSEVGSSAIQIITTAMSMAQGIQSLQSGDIQLMLGSLELTDKSNEQVLKSLGQGLSEDDVRLLLDGSYVNTLWEQFTSKSDGSHDDSYDDDPDFISDWKNSRKSQVWDKLGNVIDSISQDKRLPLSLRRKLKKSFKPGAHTLDVDSKLYELLENTYGHKKSAIENAGHPFSQLGFEDALKVFGKHINKTVIKLRESDAEVRELENKFTSDKLSVVGEDGQSLGTHAGKSDLNAYDAESRSKEYQSIVDGMWNDILNDLKELDSLGANILMFLIPIARSWLSNLSLPSVSHSTSIDQKGNSSSQSSWSF